MITSWDIYWITRLDAILGAAVILTIILAIAVPLFLVLSATNYFDSLDAGHSDTYREHSRSCFLVWRKVTIISSPFLIFFALAVAMTPTTKEAVAIYMVPKIVNNEQVQKLPDNAMKFLNTKLESWISEMGEKQKK